MEIINGLTFGDETALDDFSNSSKPSFDKRIGSISDSYSDDYDFLFKNDIIKDRALDDDFKVRKNNSRNHRKTNNKEFQNSRRHRHKKKEPKWLRHGKKSRKRKTDYLHQEDYKQNFADKWFNSSSTKTFPFENEPTPIAATEINIPVFSKSFFENSTNENTRDNDFSSTNFSSSRWNDNETFEKTIGAIFRDVAESQTDQNIIKGIDYKMSELNILEPELNEKSRSSVADKYLEDAIRPQVINLKAKKFERLIKVKRNSSPKPYSMKENQNVKTIDNIIEVPLDNLTNTTFENISISNVDVEGKIENVTSNDSETVSNLESEFYETTPVFVDYSISESTTSNTFAYNFSIHTDTPFPTETITQPESYVSTTIIPHSYVFNSMDNNETSDNKSVQDIQSNNQVTKEETFMKENKSYFPQPVANVTKSLNTDVHASGEQSSISWLSLFFCQYRNTFWMIINSLLLIASIKCGLLALYRLVWLQWCSTLIPRTFYLVVHLLAFTGAAFQSVQLLHLLFGGNEGLPLILTLLLVHTPTACLIVPLWFLIYCMLSATRLNLYKSYLPTSYQLGMYSALIIVGSFMCDIITGTSHSTWFLLLSMLIITLIGIIPEIFYVLKTSKIKQVASLLQREFQGELKLLVAPTDKNNQSHQSDVKYLLRERLPVWSKMVFISSCIGIVMLVSSFILSIFFTVSHISIYVWWFFHTLTFVSQFILIICILIASSKTLLTEKQDNLFLFLFHFPRTLHRPNTNANVNNENFVFERVSYSSGADTSQRTSTSQNESDDQHFVRNNSSNPQYRHKPSIRRSATFNCNSQNQLYRMRNYAHPSFHIRGAPMPHLMHPDFRPRGNTMLVQERGYIRFRMPMETNLGVDVPQNHSNIDDINIYHPSGYGSLRKLPTVLPSDYHSDGYPRNVGYQEGFYVNDQSQELQKYKINHIQRHHPRVYNVRQSLYRNSSFTVPQSSLNRNSSFNEHVPYLMRTYNYAAPNVLITPHSHSSLIHSNPQTLTTFKPSDSVSITKSIEIVNDQILPVHAKLSKEVEEIESAASACSKSPTIEIVSVSLNQSNDSAIENSISKSAISPLPVNTLPKLCPSRDSLGVKAPAETYVLVQDTNDHTSSIDCANRKSISEECNLNLLPTENNLESIEDADIVDRNEQLNLNSVEINCSPEEIDLQLPNAHKANLPSVNTVKRSSLVRNHSTAACFSPVRSPKTEDKAIGTDDINFEFAKPAAKNEKYPWYGTWGGRKKSRKGIYSVGLSDQFPSTSTNDNALKDQPNRLSASRTSLISLYSKLKLKTKRFSTVTLDREENKDFEKTSTSSCQDEENLETDTSQSEDTTSVSKDIESEEEENETSEDNKSVDWTLELIKSSELLSGFYSVQNNEENASIPEENLEVQIEENESCNDVS